MADSLASSNSSTFQDIVEFLEDIEQSVDLLKSRISSLSARYPVTAHEKRLNQLIQKIQGNVHKRIKMEKLLRETPPSLDETPPPLEETLPPSSSEGTVESIPTPPQEVSYPVVLYNSSCLRRRTVDQVGKLELTLPRKKRVKVMGIKVETLTNDKYDPEKRASEWMKELTSLSLKRNTSNIENEQDYKGEEESWDSEDTAPSNAQVIVLDIGKTNFKSGTIPFFFFGNLQTRQKRFSLSSKEYAQLGVCDPRGRLEIALKLAASNYEYWSSVYYKGLRSKEKDPMQRTLVKEYLRHYIKDPLNSSGLIIYYQIQNTNHNEQLQCQAYIGKCEGSLVEKLKEIQEENREERPSLLKLAFRSKYLYSEENEVDMGDIGKKNVVLILDFGYTEEFVEKYKDRLDKGDRLSVLQKNYIEFFGTKSPLGLN